MGRLRSSYSINNSEAEEAWESAQKALEEAQRLPGGPERIDALKRVGKLRLEASKLRQVLEDKS